MTILWSVTQVSIDRDEMQVGSLLSAGTFHSPLDHVSAALDRWPGLAEKHLILVKPFLFSIPLASLFRSSLVARGPCRVGHFAP
jgi:hypothetical protein